LIKYVPNQTYTVVIYYISNSPKNRSTTVRAIISHWKAISVEVTDSVQSIYNVV
jgi:hypothetical protein